MKQSLRAGRFCSLADKTDRQSHHHDTYDLVFKVGELFDFEPLERLNREPMTGRIIKNRLRSSSFLSM
jgi:hypothetical protein